MTLPIILSEQRRNNMKAIMDDYDIKAFNRLFNKTAIQENGCWNFTGACNPIWDQGVFWYRGKNRIASRVAYLLCTGDIPDDICVLHTCDNPSCINPEHLFLGTFQDNTDDMINKNRKPLGEEATQNSLTEEMVRNIREEIKYVSQSILAKRYKVTKSAIKHITKNRSWKHIL